MLHDRRRSLVGMAPRTRKVALAISVPGILLCIVAISSFFVRIVNNGLQWNEQPFFREHYRAVGRAYSEAFIVGFFLCFFVVVGFVAIGSWIAAARSAPGDD